jgi:hypothetical protein
MLLLATGCLCTVGVIGVVVSAVEGELHWFVVMPVALPLALWFRSLAYARVAKALGETTMEIDDEGVRASRSSGHAVMTWQAYGGYVETSQRFVLLGPDRGRTIFTVLPKRGAGDPTDVERLREILRRHLPVVPHTNQR